MCCILANNLGAGIDNLREGEAKHPVVVVTVTTAKEIFSAKEVVAQYFEVGITIGVGISKGKEGVVLHLHEGCEIGGFTEFDGAGGGLVVGKGETGEGINPVLAEQGGVLVAQIARA